MGKSKKVRRTTKTQPITDPRMIKKILEIKGRDGIYFSLALFTGLRANELLELKWKHIIDENTGNPRYILKRFISKQQIWREITLAHECRVQIPTRWKEAGEPDLDLFIFRGTRGSTSRNKPMSYHSARVMVRRNMEKIEKGSAQGTHCLRKTFARRYFEEFGLPMTMKVLGHRHANTTLEYIGLTKEIMASSYLFMSYMDKYDSLLSKLKSGRVEYRSFVVHALTFTATREETIGVIKDYLRVWSQDDRELELCANYCYDNKSRPVENIELIDNTDPGKHGHYSGLLPLQAKDYNMNIDGF